MLHKKSRLDLPAQDETKEETPQKKQKPAPRSTYHILNSFRKKDLIFGLLSGHRTLLDNELSSRNYPYYYANQLNNPAVGLVVSGSKNLSALTYYQKAHYRYLSRHSKYLLRPNGKTVPRMKDNPVEGAAYRRACKLLVRSANPSFRVHFELSGIDMARVCNKNEGDLGVTNSELRAAYRESRQYGENPNLFFYMYGEPCAPPWKQPLQQKNWQAYDELHAKKKAAQTNDDSKMKAENDKGAPKLSF